MRSWGARRESSRLGHRRPAGGKSLFGTLKASLPALEMAARYGRTLDAADTSERLGFVALSPRSLVTRISTGT
jgi:hypothetical protein